MNSKIATILLVIALSIVFTACSHNEQSFQKSQSSLIPGTWQTASIVCEADGSMAPEYYVRFTGSEINYGHMNDGEFVPDHSDKVFLFEKTETGGFKVRAEASNGVQYTYLTSESDNHILEYYETWNEAAFPEMYRGGASLSMNN